MPNVVVIGSKHNFSSNFSSHTFMHPIFTACEKLLLTLLYAADNIFFILLFCRAAANPISLTVSSRTSLGCYSPLGQLVFIAVEIFRVFWFLIIFLIVKPCTDTLNDCDQSKLLIQELNSHRPRGDHQIMEFWCWVENEMGWSISCVSKVFWWPWIN